MMIFLVQDLLDYAQIKAGKFRKNITQFNIKNMVEEVMCIQRNQANQKQLKFEAYFENIPQDLIICDKQRIMQVLLGLQSNAMKFTKQGHIFIKISILDSSYLRIRIEDTGIGIASKDKGKLFKLFGFIQDSHQMNTQGIGLGLLIAKQIVQQFDGKIGFQSELGVGSDFEFTFKLSKEDDIFQDRQEENKIQANINSIDLKFNWVPR